MSTATRKLHIKKLTIQNFATFDRQEIHFVPGMNSIVGETGSGKSLILDAIELILGHRADKKIIRKGEEFASIEAIFDYSGTDIKNYFDKCGYPIANDEIIIKRVVYQNDSSKSFLNFQQCPLSELVNFARSFTDLVGQFENQKLLTEEYQLELLDQFAGLTSKRELYSSRYLQFETLRKEIETALELKNRRNEREEFLRFQLNDLRTLSPTPEDEEKLIELKSQILNHDKIIKTLDEVKSILDGDGDGAASIGITSELAKARNLLEKIAPHIPSKIIDDLNSAISLIDESTYSLAKTNLNDDNNLPFGDIIDRLDFYQKLKSRFNKSTHELMSLKSGFENELMELAALEDTINKKKTTLAIFKSDLAILANEMHKERATAAKKLSTRLSESVRKLKMEGADLKIIVKEAELNLRGGSALSFEAELNPGEGFFKVKNIASGGELSRILLSLRQLISDNESISIFLFDEIDTGIGGETALKIGEALKEVSTKSQVVTITHLPQIAQIADRIIKVSKSIEKSGTTTRTHSFIEQLDGHEKQKAIKEMSALH